jgi:hypothetical protein
MDRQLGVTIARAIVVIGGVLLAALGIVLFFTDPSLPITGLILIGLGVAMIVGALIERMRYRSANADASAARPGPGGGEPIDQPMDPRFQRTDEQFVDPTTNVRMRVWIDPSSGERRYRAEP